ncbi:alpha/beta fold hydrolase [Mesonia sp. K7]|uniref:alpha/beta fold hydrolase n=1 Tax=Mesonia sp. K7 TaxID=2218606 RepID=UPI000DAA6284|nr:alpha/beta fold hydrolase [Mesonia sp. K7]PZD78453.1 alpha/beta hydrolase [Mesonia sp. K7]
MLIPKVRDRMTVQMLKTLSYKNISVSYSIFGSGKTIVLLHGFLESSCMWRETVEILQEKYQIVTIDLLGHGKTDKLGYIHTMRENALLVKSVLETERIKKTSFVGHSMGGYVALAFVELFPKMMTQLVLLNSTSSEDSQERKDNRDRAIRLLKQNKTAFISMAINNLFAEENRENLTEQIKSLVAEAQQMPIESIVATIEGMKNRKDRTDVLKNFKGEKLIIAGEKDEVIPIQNIQEIATKTQTPIKILEGGHMSWLEAKANYIKSLEGFL